MTRIIVATFITTCLMAGAAFAQTQISVTPTVVAPGQSVTITVTGTPGRFFAIIGSSVNSGVSYAGVPLAVGTDFTIIAMSSLNSSGQAVVSYTPPFNGTTFDRFYLQAATSTAANFVPLELSGSVIVRNGDLVSGLTGPPGPAGASEGWFVGGSPGASVDLPGLSNFLVWGVVVVTNNSAAEFRASCTVAGNVSGAVALAVGDVAAGKRTTLPLLASVTTPHGPATITLHCGSLPPNVTVGAGLTAIQVAVLH